MLHRVMHYQSQVSEEDRKQIKELLGREPRGLMAVERRSQLTGMPSVIKVFPYVEKSPFPTLFWLTCPILKKEISHLEKDGLVSALEKDVFYPGSDKLKKLKKQHLQYASERWQIFETSNDETSLIPPNKLAIIQETGIGGISDFDHIKCLHLHYAHHLARENNEVGHHLEEHFQLGRFH